MPPAPPPFLPAVHGKRLLSLPLDAAYRLGSACLLCVTVHCGFRSCARRSSAAISACRACRAACYRALCLCRLVFCPRRLPWMPFTPPACCWNNADCAATRVRLLSPPPPPAARDYINAACGAAAARNTMHRGFSRLCRRHRMGTFCPHRLGHTAVSRVCRLLPAAPAARLPPPLLPARTCGTSIYRCSMGFPLDLLGACLPGFHHAYTLDKWVLLTCHWRAAPAGTIFYAGCMPLHGSCIRAILLVCLFLPFCFTLPGSGPASACLFWEA